MLTADLQHSDVPCPLPHTGKYTDSLRTTSTIKFPPHILFTRIYSTHLRIYASTYLHFRRNHIRGTPTHLHCRFRCRQHHHMTSSYDWPCSLQIYSIQMPHAAAAYGQIYEFSADNLANKISAAYYVYPHLQYTYIYLRILVIFVLMYHCLLYTSPSPRD